MAFDRLKALENYIDQCSGTPNFDTFLEEQCCALAKELQSTPKMSLEEAGPLVALIKQNKYWSERQKETLVKTIQSAVQQAMCGKSLTGRLAMQDFTWCPLYLAQKDWDVLLSDLTNAGDKCACVMRRLCSLGLRCPSEETQAMVTVLMLLRDPHRYTCGIQMRSSYLTVKNLMSDFVKKKRIPGPADELEYLACLPASPGALPDGFRKAAYGEDEGPVEKLPKGISIESLRQLMSVVPMRSSNVSLRGWQLPKSTGPAFMPLGNMHMWQQHTSAGMFWPQQAPAPLHPAFHPGCCVHFGAMYVFVNAK